VAVAADVFDIEVLDAMAGGEISSIVRCYKPYFDNVRTTPERASWFAELKWLGNQIEKLRGHDHPYVPLASRAPDSTPD
jgi:hypothetical protein